MLILAQVDHVSGELLGEVLEQFHSVGASNVQLIHSLTKKGRPGQLLLIDVEEGELSTVEEALVAHLGVTGWHRLPTVHTHVATEIVTHSLTFHTAAGRLKANVRGKRLKDTRGAVKPEHASCVALRRQLQEELGVDLPIRELVRLIGQALNRDGDGAEIDLRPGAGPSPRAKSSPSKCDQ